MGRKRTPGIYKRFGVWHIDKQVNGQRICESTGAVDLEEAERYLARRVESIRQATVYGVRPKRLFKEAATKFLLENQHKASISSDAGRLKYLIPFIGGLPLESVHMGTLQPFIVARRAKGLKTRTINHGLQVVRHILNLAASEWMDEHGLTWLLTAPKIKLLPEPDLRKPYPLDWDEQTKLFNQLPPHLHRMALFAVNTGCRDAEICNLRWEWEVAIPGGSVFIIPGEHTKNDEDRLVVLNEIAKSVIESVRGQHPQYVFIFRGKPSLRMLNTGWQKTRVKVGLPNVRVHDLKHTFGRRLRAAGVSFEDRQDLLGHKSGRITTHYSEAEISNLLEAANVVCEQRSGVKLTVLRRVLNPVGPAKVPQRLLMAVK
jgi:integrase